MSQDRTVSLTPGLSNVQYRPVSRPEGMADAPLSVRYYRDLAEGVNNAKYHTHAPRRNMLFVPPIKTVDNYATAAVLMTTAPLYVPDGFSTLLVYACHKRSSGAGRYDFKLYASLSRYVGYALSFAESGFFGYYDYAAFGGSSDAWGWTATAGISLYEPLVGQYVYFTLVGQNENVTTRGECLNISIKAVP